MPDTSLLCLTDLCRRLSRDVLKDERTADLATLLYIWNPASVFYSAAYTESIFACAAFTGLYLLSQQPWLATVCLSIASATRSNGMSAHMEFSYVCCWSAEQMASSAGVLHCWLLLHKLATAIANRKRLFQASLMSFFNMSQATLVLRCV